jgi:hypothetical protein
MQNEVCSWFADGQARLYLDPIQLFNFSSLTNLEQKQRLALKQVSSRDVYK